MRYETLRLSMLTLVGALIVTGCTGEGESEPAVDPVATTRPVATEPIQAPPTDPDTRAQARPEPPPPPPPDMRLEVNLAKRELYVYRDGERVATHPVAVGSEKWPTPTGEWSVVQVIWNPRWIPPKEEWAEEAEVTPPGDPENPLGRAQLVYRPPNSIHGTDAESSLGKAVSHGSIRVSNEVAMELARQVMEEGGAGKDESWYRAARENPKARRAVDIPNPIPIRVVEGESEDSGSGS